MTQLPAPWTRFIRFNAVGAAGIGVQLAVLAVVKGHLGMHYLLATALAVEAAVLHNYVWHVKWTWRDRTRNATAAYLAGSLWKFHIGNGAVSLVVNLGMMRVLVGSFGLNYLASNMLAIAAGGVANFLLSDRFIFLTRRDPAN